MFEKPPENRAESKDISFGEVVVGGLLIGLAAKFFYKEKKDEIDQVFEETKQDFTSHPTMIKEVVGNAINSIESLVLNDLIEHQTDNDGECVCDPDLELVPESNTVLVKHFAFDGRL